MENNYSRKIQVKFRVNELEKAVIKERMKRIGEKDMGRFLRTMAIKGECHIYDYTPVVEQIRELNYYIGSISRSVNQIAKTVNTTGTLHEDDLNDLREKIDGMKKNQLELMKACLPKKYGGKGNDSDCGRGD
ncbi:MAG: hypothetical protein LUG86_08825 [Oscillospiraceae bacterium]|nr:hypothetical protein [Oscillospiraceae bacterium]